MEEVPQNENAPFHPYSPSAVEIISLPVRLRLQHTIRKFTTLAFANDGIEFEWKGEGTNEMFEYNLSSTAMKAAAGKRMQLLLGAIQSDCLRAVKPSSCYWKKR